MAENETHSRGPVSPGEMSQTLPPVEGRLDGHDPRSEARSTGLVKRHAPQITP